MAILILHGPGRVAVRPDGHAADGSDYVAYLGIAPLALRSGQTAGWDEAAPRLGTAEPPPGIAPVLRRAGVLGFAQAAKVALRAARLSGPVAEALGGAPDEIWAIKEGPVASVWRVAGPAGALAVNVSRDRLAARELAASAERLGAAARALDAQGASGISVAPVLATHRQGAHLALIQPWVEGGMELGLFHDPRAGGAPTLAVVERFLGPADTGSGRAGMRGWALRGPAAEATLAGIARLAAAFAESGLSAGSGASALTIGEGDFVARPGGLTAIACDGAPCPGAPPSPEALAGSLLKGLAAGQDVACRLALAVAAAERPPASSARDGRRGT